MAVDHVTPVLIAMATTERVDASVLLLLLLLLLSLSLPLCSFCCCRCLTGSVDKTVKVWYFEDLSLLAVYDEQIPADIVKMALSVDNSFLILGKWLFFIDVPLICLYYLIIHKRLDNADFIQSFTRTKLSVLSFK